MSKVAVICDTHYGIKSDSLVMLDHFKRFYSEVFFPELERRNIKTVLHLGDLVDRRKYINMLTAQRMRQDFLEPLSKYDVHIIAGNHDCYFKSTNSVNSFNELLKGYPYNVYTEPKLVNIEGCEMLLVPWICADNYDFTVKAIKHTAGVVDVCMGHLELEGFEMARGQTMLHGYKASMFEQFDVVASGHYHHKSSKGNVNYLGAPYEMTWSDYNDPKGFHIFDTEKHTFEFIENPNKIYFQIEYDDRLDIFDQIDDFDLGDVSNCFIKVVVTHKSKPYTFDRLIEKLDKAGPADLKIIENMQLSTLESELVNETQDTLTILANYVAAVDDAAIDKPKLTDLLRSLYVEASAIEA